MALRTSDEFVDGLSDGREVYYGGARVEDVTTHPVLSTSVEHAASEFDAQFDAPDVFVTERDGERFSRYFEPVEDQGTLERRRRLVRESTCQSDGVFNCIRAIGSDGLHALAAVLPAVDERQGTAYTTRLRSQLERVRRADLGVAVAMTDAKGDRSKRPSEQTVADTYVRVVERRPDGIVIRGAKVHTSHGPVSDELLVLPGRGLAADEEDFAVACLVPCEASGLRFVCRRSWGDVDARDAPVSSRRDEIESVTLFDDVFVPAERVFLDGYPNAAGEVVEAFATYHRFTALCYRPEFVDLLLGVVELLAESNGLSDARGVRRARTDLIEYIETVRGLAVAAAATPAIRNGRYLPNPTYCNVGKHRFASEYHDVCRTVQDIAGGLAVTVPPVAAFDDDTVGETLTDVLGGSDGWDGRRRRALFALVSDLTVSRFAGWQEVLSLHGEGSLAAQRRSMHAAYDRAAATDRARVLLDRAVGTENNTPGGGSEAPSRNNR